MARKKVSDWLTAWKFAKCEESVKNFVLNSQGFLFMNQIKAIPAFWKKILGEV